MKGSNRPQKFSKKPKSSKKGHARLLASLALAIAIVLAARYRWPYNFNRDALLRQISGRADIIDGDSMKIGSRVVRLEAIDAPEGRQSCQNEGKRWPCGERAADRLRALTRGATLNCMVSRLDRIGRALATCYRGGLNINRQMVVDGWAVVFRGHDRYRRAERAAARGKKGIWTGKFERPHLWRDKHMGRR